MRQTIVCDKPNSRLPGLPVMLYSFPHVGNGNYPVFDKRNSLKNSKKIMSNGCYIYFIAMLSLTARGVKSSERKIQLL